MKYDRRRRHLRPQPTRRQIHQEINRACHLHELFQIERVMELSKPAPDLAHLRYIGEQLASLEDIVVTLEAY